LRFWLLGNWIAAQKNLDFYLINLVLEERDHNIETDFGKHIVQGRSSRFIRISWEDIYSQILKDGAYLNDTHRIIEYFKNKTIGYDGLGQLQKAFTVN